jgi:hypothetical protein
MMRGRIPDFCASTILCAKIYFLSFAARPPPIHFLAHPQELSSSRHIRFCRVDSATDAMAQYLVAHPQIDAKQPPLTRIEAPLFLTLLDLELRLTAKVRRITFGRTSNDRNSPPHPTANTPRFWGAAYREIQIFKGSVKPSFSRRISYCSQAKSSILLTDFCTPTHGSSLRGATT